MVIPLFTTVIPPAADPEAPLMTTEFDEPPVDPIPAPVVEAESALSVAVAESVSRESVDEAPPQ